MPSESSSASSGLQASLPIGVFDSGIGGLTVLRALRQHLPAERFIYLGDTARLPYGTKSSESVLRYSMQAANFLVRRQVKFLIVACNTASSVAVGPLREMLAPIPVLGVIEPGAEAGCRASRSGKIAVLATEGTVRGQAYQRAIASIRGDAQVIARACSLFVALAEEGWSSGPVAEMVARQYLDDMLREHPDVDTLLLGCTHFPVLAPMLRKVVGPRLQIVDSAQTTAQALVRELGSRGLRNPGPDVGPPLLLATDGPERFARVGSLFLGESFGVGQVELVDISEAAGS